MTLQSLKLAPVSGEAVLTDIELAREMIARFFGMAPDIVFAGAKTPEGPFPRLAVERGQVCLKSGKGGDNVIQRIPRSDLENVLAPFRGRVQLATEDPIAA